MTKDPAKILISAPSAAKMLDISPSTLRRAVIGGLLTPVRLHPNGHPRFRTTDIHALADRLAPINETLHPENR